MAEQPDIIKQALALAKKGQYQKARYLLNDVQTDPRAKKLLKQMEGRNDKLQGGLSAFYSPTILVMIGFGIVVLLFFFNFVGNVQTGVADRGALQATFGERGIIGNANLYVDLVLFCYDQVEDTPDSCMDWSELVMTNYYNEIYGCVIITDSGIDYRNRELDAVATCYNEAGIPAPGTVPVTPSD